MIFIVSEINLAEKRIIFHFHIIHTVQMKQQIWVPSILNTIFEIIF